MQPYASRSKALLAFTLAVGAVLTWGAAYVVHPSLGWTGPPGGTADPAIAGPLCRNDPARQQRFGHYDLEFIWRAYTLLARHESPYSVELLNSAAAFPCNPFHWNAIEFKFVYPPWLLPFGAPVLALPFDRAVFVWSLLQAVFFSAAVLLVARARRTSAGPPELLALALVLPFSPPVIDALLWGNIPVLSVLGYTILCGRRERVEHPLVMGFALLLLSFKPHLALGLVLVLPVLFSARAVLGGLLAAAAMAGGLAAVVEVARPGTFADYLFVGLRVLGLHVSGASGDTATVLAARMIAYDTGISPNALRFAIALVMHLLVTFAVRGRVGRGMERPFAVVLVAAAAPILAPYGWFQDQSLAILLAAYLVAERGAAARLAPVAAVILWGILTWSWVLTTDRYFLRFFPYSFGVLLIAVVSRMRTAAHSPT